MNLDLFGGLYKSFVKIDLISEKIQKFDLKHKKTQEKSWISCFSHNYKNDFYLLGTYSKKIFLMDRANDTSFDTIEYHQGGINNLVSLSDGMCFLSGGRKDDYIYLWDLRKIDKPVNTFYRKNQSHQRIKFCLDKSEKHLISGNTDGTIFIYELSTGNIKSYFYGHNDVVSSINIHPFENLFISSSGQREFLLDDKDSDFSEEDEDKIPSSNKHSIRIWDFNHLH